MTQQEPPGVALLATLDTKHDEARYLADELERHGARPILVDVSLRGVSPASAEVARADLASLGAHDATENDRTAAMESTAKAAAEKLLQLRAAGRIAAAIGIGGGTGGWISEQAVAPLPFGFPKMVVTTVVKPSGEHDILYLPSVVDIAGDNTLLRAVLGNAAAAIAAMACSAPSPAAEKPAIAMTMFGVTTAGGDIAREFLESAGYDVVVFHATGAGGRTVERLVAEGRFAAVLDWTTTELVQNIAGGLCDAGAARLSAAATAGVPQVVVPGALDVVNVLPPVPDRFADRALHWHLPTVPLVRSSAAESAEAGAWIARELSRASAPAAVCVPRGGFSSVDVAGGEFSDPAANAAFEESLRSGLPDAVPVHTSTQHINDPEFARATAQTLLALLETATPKE